MRSGLLCEFLSQKGGQKWSFVKQISEEPNQYIMQSPLIERKKKKNFTNCESNKGIHNMAAHQNMLHCDSCIQDWDLS